MHEGHSEAIEAIEAINVSVSFVVSADINSGMHGDTGEAELVVRSDLTVTIACLKHGVISNIEEKYFKRLVRADIGIVLIREEKVIHERNCLPWLDLKLVSVCE